MPADDPFVQRVFVVDGKGIACRFFQPVAEDEAFCCRYEIAWTEGAYCGKGYGIDEVQALLLAMQTAHAHLLVARENNGRQVAWLGQRSLGLPIAETIRDWDPGGDV